MNATSPENPLAVDSRKVDLEKTELMDCTPVLAEVSVENRRQRVAERRAGLRYPCECLAFYHPTPALRHQISGWIRVRNLSVTGMALMHSKRVEPGTILRLELLSKNHRVCRKVSAQVVHAAPLPYGGWVLGCAFTRHLTTEDLQALLAPYYQHGTKFGSHSPTGA